MKRNEPEALESKIDNYLQRKSTQEVQTGKIGSLSVLHYFTTTALVLYCSFT